MELQDFFDQTGGFSSLSIKSAMKMFQAEEPRTAPEWRQLLIDNGFMVVEQQAEPFDIKKYATKSIEELREIAVKRGAVGEQLESKAKILNFLK